MAHGLFREKVIQEGLEDFFEIDSAGTSGHHTGEAPDSRAQATMLTHSIDISDLRSRKFEKRDFHLYDQIVVMDRSNFRNVQQMAKATDEEVKISMMLDHSLQHRGFEVPDPYYGGDEGFENVYQMLNDACDELIKKWRP